MNYFDAHIEQFNNRQSTDLTGRYSSARLMRQSEIRMSIKSKMSPRGATLNRLSTTHAHIPEKKYKKNAFVQKRKWRWSEMSIAY
jgi:hypothetical protein